MKILIIDKLGLNYDGTTLEKSGLGGSETAVICMARELAKIGFDVTVMNNCYNSEKEISPGIYDNVQYVRYNDLNLTTLPSTFDIVICSRSLEPFKIMGKISAYKVLWMHDTFTDADHALEEMVVNGQIDEIFTLSDFHSVYVTNCTHGRRRNFEVLKNKVFQTRNGMVPQDVGYVDINKKNPYRFVYNASVSKGLEPLLNDIWPKIYARYADKNPILDIIGGYYSMGTPDKQELKWRSLKATHNKKNGVYFHGIIKQNAIAEILKVASFTLYPGAFPETFGISTLESMYYNTPVITCRFGALEQVALEECGYLLDYAIQPNILFTDIDKNKQVEKFIDMAFKAIDTRYLWQQKANACHRVKAIAGWDTVALQWKQHFFYKLGKYLPVSQYRDVSEINEAVRQILKPRFTNPEQGIPIKIHNQTPIKIIVPFYNAEDYIIRCAESIAAQDYSNYEVFFINDNSTDNGYNILKKALETSFIPYNLKNNLIRVGALENQWDAIQKYIRNDDIVMLIDGDDALPNNPNIFHYYNNLFRDNSTDLAYGSCWSEVDNIPLIAEEYPPDVIARKGYREHKLTWGIPYTHLRVFLGYLGQNIDERKLKDTNGNFFMAGGDGALMYALLEQLDRPNQIHVCREIHYLYNDKNPINDYKVNSDEQKRNAHMIAPKIQPSFLAPNIQPSLLAPPQIHTGAAPINVAETKFSTLEYRPITRVLIAFPTKTSIESETFKSVYDLIIPEGVETYLEFFYGYQIDQIRDLIAHYAITNGFDYVLCVDHDIVMPPNTLHKFLELDKDIVSGVYVQRLDPPTIELWGVDGKRVETVPEEPFRIMGCGLGGALIKTQVFKDVGYPQFDYHKALDHKDTVSEDFTFCKKAFALGKEIWADGTIHFLHKGTRWFTVPKTLQFKKEAKMQIEEDPIKARLRDLSSQGLLPQAHINHLAYMRDMGINPSNIYDIGSCVLHWTKEAHKIWPNAKIFCFEAMSEVQFLYNELQTEPDRWLYYYNTLLSDVEDEQIEFNQNLEHPGGNSYYEQNEEIIPETRLFFNEENKILRRTTTLQRVKTGYLLPPADLIKMDVQGAELDILKGYPEFTETTTHLILELQHVEYNKGAPLAGEVIDWLDKKDFELVGGKPFCLTKHDGDYHFRNRRFFR